MTLDLDRLFIIAESAPQLDQAEALLRERGHEDMAAALNKLQQDAGVQIDREMNGYDPEEPAPGPETARLNASYEEVTADRLAVLAQAHKNLPEGNIRVGVEGVMYALGVNPIALPAYPANLKTTGSPSSGH